MPLPTGPQTPNQHQLPKATSYYEQLAALLPTRNGCSKLTVSQLACALYEGTPHLSNLAETLARQHGKAGALTFFDMMGPDVQNFWRGIAKQLIDHSKHWLENQGSGCVLDDEETQRLKSLPRVPVDDEG